jgi:hypothetical protein
MRFATPNTVRHRGITAVATNTIRMVSTTNAIFMAIRRRFIVVIFGVYSATVQSQLAPAGSGIVKLPPPLLET